MTRSRAQTLLRFVLGRMRRDDGAVTVEAVLWIPFFFLLLLAVTDMALIMHGQSRVLRIAQDETRQWSAGVHQNAEETEAAITNRLIQEKLLIVENGVPQFSVIVVDSISGIIQTEVAVSAKGLDAVGLVTAFSDLAMIVKTQHIMEN